MNTFSPRRTFLKALAGATLVSIPETGNASPLSVKSKRLKTGLNAYSFNAPLMNKTMTLDNLIDFCAEAGFDGLDITGYYFEGYPSVPTDEALFRFKRKAFREGLEISGTGVRNDFTIADKEKRKKEVELVKNWVEVAAKLGAPVLRIFAGTQKNDGIPREQVMDWMLKDIEICVDYGKKNGVIIGLQNHFDFVQTSDQVIPFFETIRSEWFGLILDTGSYRIGDPYKEIERTIKYAVNWQLKEKIFVDGKEIDTDLERVINLIKKSDYQGYIPIETLGAGDPKVKVEAMIAKVKKFI